MIFAAFFCLEGSKLPLGTPRQPGPALLPLGYGGLLFFLAAIFVLRSGLKREETGDSARSPWRGLKWKRVPYVLAGVLGYAFCLEFLGYLISTTFLMIVLFLVKGLRRTFLVLSGGLAITIITYILFKGLLKVRLPSGFLGI